MKGRPQRSKKDRLPSPWRKKRGRGHGRSSPSNPTAKSYEWNYRKGRQELQDYSVRIPPLLLLSPFPTKFLLFSYRGMGSRSAMEERSGSRGRVDEQEGDYVYRYGKAEVGEEKR